LSRKIWRIATDAPGHQAHDLSGAGAKATGGRWNESGIAMVYASETRALACLETSVHLNAGGLPFNRYSVEITIPDAVWADAQQEMANGLRVGWDAEPAGRKQQPHQSRSRQ
jgi:RES domain-containing protein